MNRPSRKKFDLVGLTVLNALFLTTLDLATFGPACCFFIGICVDEASGL